MKPQDSSMPPLSAPLIEALIRIFPPQSVTPASSIPQIMFNAGQQDVIEFLKREHARQVASYTPRLT